MGLLILALIIGLSSIMITGRVVRSLSLEERKKMEIWAAAIREIADMDSEIADFSFFLRVIQDNETVPVIIVDDSDKILDHWNLNPSRLDNSDYLDRRLAAMKKQNAPIEIVFFDDVVQLLYYGDSKLLVWLAWYPYIQLTVIILFLLAAYYVFSISRKAEQNQVWLGMSKETAHQLATPISSLIAWLEIMKEKEHNSEMLHELEKDIGRLEKITARFSKIGSTPQLHNENIITVIDNSIDYLRGRSSKNILFDRVYQGNDNVLVPVNVPLFEWVIENVCKNALDAMDGNGTIRIGVEDRPLQVWIDISDSGKGISRRHFAAIFKPGYTTRRNGWGLGLSLSKRIIEQYHNGRIFVLRSAVNAGTTMRIILNKH